MSSKLKNILACTKLGIPILPLAPEDLEPAVAGGTKAAVTDPKTLRSFYKKHPDYNYGLVMGGGIFAVSMDDRDARSRLWTLASDHGGRLSKTVTLRFGDTRFYLFRSDGTQISDSNGQLGKGIDVWGEGSYVPGPGTSPSSGEKCRFAQRRALGDVEIAKSPEWLSSMLSAAPAPASSYPRGSQAVVSLPVSAIFVDPEHPVDSEDVLQLDSSIEVLGLHTPITVMPRKGGGSADGAAIFEVVAGHTRLAAMKNRRCDRVDAFVVRDEIDARLWGIAEDIDRRVPSVVEVAEKTAQFDALLRLKLDGQVVQAAPPGGEQPRDKGIRKAAKRLGISREKMRRRRLVSGLSAEAKAEAKALGMEDNQAALLEAAKEGTPAAQVAKVREIAARKRAPRHQETAGVEKLSAPVLSAKVDQRSIEVMRAADRAEESSLKAELEVKTSAIASLQADLTAKDALLKKLEAELAAVRRTASPANTFAPPKVAQDVGDDIPAFLDRRPLSAEDQRAFDAIMAAWAKSTDLRAALVAASPVIHERFFAVVRVEIASASSASP